MSDWITHRPPTRADADINGKIVVRYDGAILKPWDAILPEEHWSHTSLYRHTIEPAPEPPATVATASEFPEAIRSGAAPFYVVVVSNEDPQNPGGEAFVLEHPIPRTTTLQSVLRQQRLHGHRYGTTYIAECRIIPQLTSEVPAQ